MKYDQGDTCVKNVVSLSDDVINQIEELTGIKVSVLLAIGSDNPESLENKIVPIVSEKELDGVESVNFPEPTTNVLDIASISVVKIEGCHEILHPLGIKVQCRR